MAKRIAEMAFIFLATSVAWMVLGSTTEVRSVQQDKLLKGAVGQLWGKPQMQRAPEVYFRAWKETSATKEVDGKTVTETHKDKTDYLVKVSSSDLGVDPSLQYRKKGLYWYSTYRVKFSGKYLIENTGDTAREYYVDYRFPNKEGIYDDFILSFDGKPVKSLYPVAGLITEQFTLGPGESTELGINYGAQGMDEWWYVFGTDVSQIRNLDLTMTTNFDAIDFPENGIAPTGKEKIPGGWKLNWKYSNLISGIQIGMEMPRKLNPGPFVSRVSFFAPVSLFLFMFLMFIITTVRKIKIHVMNYFFIAASFFSFHLLLAYLVDHISLGLAFIISSVVSIILVTTYMRLAIGLRFAILEIGLSQLIYLVLFSYAFFLEGFTGLAITICCILTLFTVMQFTAKFNWEKGVS